MMRRTVMEILTRGGGDGGGDDNANDENEVAQGKDEYKKDATHGEKKEQKEDSKEVKIPTKPIGVLAHKDDLNTVMYL